MKSKSIGSLILLAILAPSCGSGGGGDKARPPALTPRWNNQYRTPTTAHLRRVLLASSSSGIVAGEAGSFLRTSDGGASWRTLETAPAARSGNVVALSAAGRSVVAVGSDTGTPGTARVWTSEDTQQFFTDDQGGSGLPYVDVVVAVGASNSGPAGSYRLRSNGFVDVFQGSLIRSMNSALAGTVGTASAWDSAAGVAFAGTTGYGLVCGTNGGVGQIRQTADEGDSWFTLRVPPGCLPLTRFFMLSTTKGYVCGNGGTLLRITPDPAPTPVPLGFYWDNVPNKPGGLTQNLHGVHFPQNGDTGWVVGDSGTIWKIVHTPPSTWTWTQQGVGVTAEDLYDVNFVDVNVGFAVGDNGTVLKTSNGGALWTDISKPALPPPPSRTQQFNAVDFDASGINGLAVGSGGAVFRTLDAGATWTPFGTIVPSLELRGVSIPKAGSGMRAYLCGDGGIVRTNADWKGVGTWTTPTGIVATDYKTICFPLTEATGVVAGGTTVLRTIDGGMTYAAPSAPPGGSFNASASTPDGLQIYMVGDARNIYVSSTSGNTWMPVDNAGIAIGTNLFAVSVPNGPTYPIYAGGSDGLVYRYNQTGVPPAWESTTPGGGTSVRGLAFPNELTGLVLTQGASGGIFTTNNAGSLWTRSSLHHQIDAVRNLRGVVLNAALTGTAVGDSGLILRTTTGGQ